MEPKARKKKEQKRMNPDRKKEIENQL